MKKYCLAASTLFAIAIAGLAARSPEILFERKTIDLGVSETCAIADFNNDGKPDIFSGDASYENPTWKRHEVRKLKEYGTYLASLSDLPLDVDGDGFMDIVSSGWHCCSIDKSGTTHRMGEKGSRRSRRGLAGRNYDRTELDRPGHILLAFDQNRIHSFADSARVVLALPRVGTFMRRALPSARRTYRCARACCSMSLLPRR